MNGGGGLSSAELSAGARVIDARRPVALAGARPSGDLLTLLEADPEPELPLEADPGRPSGSDATEPTRPSPGEATPGSTAGQAWSRTAQELVRLAQRFARADDEEAHDLFATAFGLYGARHFGIAPEPAAADLAEVSWWHGPTVRQPLVPILTGLLPRARRARRRRGESSGFADHAAVAAEPFAADAFPAGPVADGAAVDGPLAGGTHRTNAGRHRKPSLPARGEKLCSEERRDAASAVERRAAARMLLAHPLVTATGPYAEAFGLIRRHEGWLAEQFEDLLGYPLTVTDTFARLRKSGTGPGGLRTLQINGGPCTPETYAALALTLSVLLTGPHRWPAGQLAAAVMAAAADAGFGSAGEVAAVPASTKVSPREQPVLGRQAVPAALALLTEWQVVAGAGAEGWLTVDQALAAALAAAPGVDGWPEEPRPASEAGGAGTGGDLLAGGGEVSVPVAVRRRLAESPVVLLDDLTALEREWLWESRRREAETFAEFLGLTAEFRSEGMALLDPAGELSDLRFPGGDGPAQAALLLVERLVEQLRPLPEQEDQETEEHDAAGGPVPGVPIPEALIDGILGDVADEYGASSDWCRQQLADRAAFRRDVLSLLHRMRLIAPVSPAEGPAPTPQGGWMLLAPAARYAAQAELLPAPGRGRHGRRGEHS